MKFFRNIFITRFSAALTGLLVLNMSLFLAEVEALKLLQDRQLTENIAKLLLGAANEEEKDFTGATGEEEAVSLKGADLFLHDYFMLQSHFIFTIRSLPYSNVDKTLSPFLEIFFPPPKA